MSAPFFPARSQYNILNALATDPRGTGQMIRGLPQNVLDLAGIVGRDVRATGQNIMDLPGAAGRLAADPGAALRGAAEWAARDIGATGEQVAKLPVVNEFIQGLQGVQPPNFSRVQSGASSAVSALEPAAGAPLPEELQGRGPLRPGGGAAPAQAPGFNYRVPKQEIVEPQQAAPPDFSEVGKILAEATPEELPPLDRTEMILSILGRMAEGALGGGNVGQVLAGAGAGAVSGLMGAKQENIRRQEVNVRDRARFGLAQAGMKANEVLARAGVDAQNVAQMNAYKQQVADAEYKQQIANLPKAEITPYGVTVLEPDENGRIVPKYIEGPAMQVARLNAAVKMASALGRGLRSGAGVINDIKFGAAAMPAGAYEPGTRQVMVGPYAYLSSPLGALDLERYAKLIEDGKFPFHNYDNLPELKYTDPKEYDKKLLEAGVTYIMEYVYKPEVAKLGYSPTADAHRSLLDPVIGAPGSSIQDQSLRTLMEQTVEDQGLGGALDPMFGGQ